MTTHTEADDQMMADRMAEPPETQPSEVTREVCVPLSALSIADEGQQEVAPEPGDDVNISLGGKVARVENGHAYVTVKSLNGEEVGGQEAPDEEQSMAAEGADLRKLMENA